MRRSTPLPFVAKISSALLLVIFGGVMIHAPLSVWLSSQLPGYSVWFKSWKELLLLIVSLLTIWIIIKTHNLKLLTRDRLLWLIGGLTLVYVSLIPWRFQGASATIAGLMIDLRFLLFFSLVYVHIRLFPSLRRLFLWIGAIGAGVVLLFGVLQVLVLPKDILANIGYSKATIQPYLTVDQNQAYVRINSTLRGPNSLGAFTVIVLSVLTALVLKKRLPRRLSAIFLAILASLTGLICLWASYSRSAIVALVIAAIALPIIIYGRISKKAIINGIGAILLVVGVVGLTWHTDFMQQVLVHNDPTQGNDVNSDQGHIASLQQGIHLLGSQPLGGGIGSTGSASLYQAKQPLVIENYYLLVAHEGGWLGLLLFLVINGAVLWLLWKRRRDWLAVGVLASGLGLVAANLVLPIWADDTISLIWWGIAAVVLGSTEPMRYNEADRGVLKHAKRSA